MKNYSLELSVICVVVLCMNNAQAADEEMFLRTDRMVHSEKQLVERIRQCELGNELAWFEEEVDDVAAYLAQEYYRFNSD